MAVVIGTNAGFVDSAPVDDPAGSNSNIDAYLFGVKDTSSASATKVTEIGWYCDNATEESNFEVGIYDHNAGDDEPGTLLAGVSRTNAKGTGSGWKKVTGLNITISPSTIYWIVAQLDDTATASAINYTAAAGTNVAQAAATLPDIYGSGGTGSTAYAVYAVCAASTTVTPSTLTLSTTSLTPDIITATIILPSTLTLSATAQSPTIDIHPAGGIGTAEIRTSYPVISGLGADDKHEGRQMHLIPEISLVPAREKIGLVY